MSDQIVAGGAGKRELALERSQKVSRALHDAARRARQTVRGNATWQPGFSRAARGSRRFALLSALLLFVLPTLASALYLGLIASDRYQTETRFAVKGRQVTPTDAIGQLTGLPSLQQAQDSLVVMDYVRSRTIVEKLDAELDLRAMFSRPGIDWFSRFDPEDPTEKLVRYWNKRVRVDVEMPANIVVLHIQAFTAEDALRISRAVLAASEALVNGLSSRSRQDALANAQDEVNRAEQRLTEIRDQYRETRNRAGLIDPEKSATEIVKLLSEMKMEKIRIENEIRVTSRSLAPNAPQSQTLRARLDAVSGQIAGLEQQLTAGDRRGDAVLSETYTTFDKARLDQEWAEKFYQTVAASLEKARIDSDRQQVYLEAFVEPVLPQEAEFPRRMWLISGIAIGTLTAWLLVMFIRSLVVR